MRKFIVAVVIVVGFGLLLLAGGYAILRGMDLNAYRPAVVAKVKDLTGRELQLKGDLGIGLQDGLLIRADELSLSNAPWGSRPEMIKVSHAKAHLALLPLLLGEIRVRRIDLHDVDLILERDASGTGNWALAPGPADNSHHDGGMPTIRVDSGRVVWRPSASGNTESWTFTELQADAGLRDDRVHLQASGKLKGQALELKGALPTWFTLAGGHVGDLDLRLEHGRMAVQAQGTVQQKTWGWASKLKVTVEHVDLARIGHFAGWTLPSIPPIALAFDVTRSMDAWQIANLDVSSGKSALAGELTITRDADRPQLTGRLTGDRLDLTELIPLKSDRKDGAKAAQSDAAEAWHQILKGLDATLQLRIARVVTWDVDLLDLQLNGQLTRGHLQLRPIEARLSEGGPAVGHFELDAAADPPDWRLALNVQDVPAGVILGPTRASLIDAPMDLDLDLKTKGRSAQHAIAHLGGDARLVIGSGRAKTQSIDSLVGGLTNLTGLLRARDSEDAQLNCAVADFAIEQGVATAKVLLLDSAVSTVRGDGQIDLGAGQIDLTFRPKAKTPTLNVAVPVHVRGPLLQPEFSADRVATVSKLLGVAGLFVYPPAALVSLGELGGSNNHCIELMRGTKAPEEKSSAAGKVTEGIGDAAKGIGSGLRKLLGQ